MRESQQGESTDFHLAWSSLRWMVACGLLMMLSSCWGRGDAPELVDVTGTIMIDGQPAHGANVQFRSKNRGLISVGQSDEGGHFRLLYKRGKWGAAIDEHQVIVETGLVGDGVKGTSIPARYGDVEQSGLVVTVSEDGPNDLTLELTSEKKD